MANFTQKTPRRGYVNILPVSADNPAYRVGPRNGDIILTVNQQRAPNIEGLMKIVNNKNNQSLLLNVIHGPDAIFVVIK